MAARRSPDRRVPRPRRGEFVGGFGQPFAMLVIADLLGVPEGDRELFLRGSLGDRPNRRRRRQHRRRHDCAQPARVPYEQFTEYVEDRRRAPRNDVPHRAGHADVPRRLDS